MNNISYQCGLSYIGQVKRKLCFRLYQHKLCIRNQETNKPVISKHCWENDHFFNFNSAKNICLLYSIFELDFLEAFHAHKIRNNIVNYDFAILPLSDCRKSSFKSNFS